MSQCRHEIMRYAGFWDGLLWWICAVDPESGCRFKIANREAVSKK